VKSARVNLFEGGSKHCHADEDAELGKQSSSWCMSTSTIQTGVVHDQTLNGSGAPNPLKKPRMASQ
jgi:hypothetical protein